MERVVVISERMLMKIFEKKEWKSSNSLDFCDSIQYTLETWQSKCSVQSTIRSYPVYVAKRKLSESPIVPLFTNLSVLLYTWWFKLKVDIYLIDFVLHYGEMESLDFQSIAKPDRYYLTVVTLYPSVRITEYYSKIMNVI